MAITQMDIRQSVLRSALNMAGTAINATVDGILTAHDANIAKLFEDRNILLTDGGLITFTGTQVSFTDNLNITLNQKISGAVPQVISLGNTTQTFTNSGDMLVAVINRTAGTASVSIVANGSSLAAVSSANQEVFLIAKRVDAGDGTQRLYWRNGFAQNAGQTLRLGQGGGTGSGVGGGSDLNSLQFSAQFIEPFTESATNSASAVNSTYTNATYSAAKQMYTLYYDASHTASGSTTSLTLSGSTPSNFTLTAGDVVVNLATGEVRRIVTVAWPTLTIDAAFAATLSTQPVCLSQAVHTKDIYNYNANSTAASLAAAFPGSTFSEVMVDYEDNATSGSNLWTPDVAPFAAYTASVDNTNWSTLATRISLETSTIQSVVCPTSGSSLYLRFFSDATSGTGFLNLLNYEAFMQKALASTQGGIVWSAYAITNGSTTPVNCSLSVVGGKTTVTFSSPNQYAVGYNSGQAYGVLDVYLNGQMLPRFVSGSVPTTDGYYTEISGNVIQLDRDYSSVAQELQVVLRTQVVDASTANNTSIANLQQFASDGFQPFVSQIAATLSATSTAGTPATGTFYSSISGRASIPDLTQDLKARMGIERIMVQSVQRIWNEFGPNGEIVSGTPNDLFNQLRFVGNWIINYSDVQGLGAYAIANSTGTDFCEITFYGTGLNLLYFRDSNSRTHVYSVDGGSNSANFYTTGPAGGLSGRSAATNQVQNLVSGLALGVHTVKITNTGTTTEMRIYGFEILNESSNVLVNPGVTYNGGKKIVNSSQSSFSYSAPVTGSTGGRVLVYQNAKGTIGQAFTAAGTSILTLTNANHSNEEVVRDYSPREFGAAWSTNDFSTLVASLGNRQGTLDDGTTSLICQQWMIDSTQFSIEAIRSSTVVNGFLTFTFIGTGCDAIMASQANAADDGQVTLSVDGTSYGSLGAYTTGFKKKALVSGLPYGTHTVKITSNSARTNDWFIQKFIVYQPKSPSIPSGATLIADYNVLANYSASAGAVLNVPATGVIRKMGANRESILGGTWSNPPTFDNTNFDSGWNCQTTTSASYMQYTFFGTGIEIGTYYNAAAYSQTVTVDGSSVLSGFATSLSQPGTGLTFSAPAGTITGTSSVAGKARIRITGLSLGTHTVRITTGNTAQMYVDTWDIVTPIYSTKSNIYSDLMNTLPVGSNSISDDRQTQPVKGLPAQKAWAVASGVISAPSTNSTSPVPMPDMSVTIKTSGGPLFISYAVQLIIANSGASAAGYIYVDGQQISNDGAFVAPTATTYCAISDSIIVPVSAGVHKVDVYWSLGGGTGTISGNNVYRKLSVQEK